MADSKEHEFTFKDVAACLVKSLGIHEGRWALSFELTLTAGIMGPSQAEAKPGAMIQISSVKLVKQGSQDATLSNVVDAAEINPKPGGSKRKTARKQARRA